MSNASNNQGRAFEFICLLSLNEAINKIRSSRIVRNSSYDAAENAWKTLTGNEQQLFVSNDVLAVVRPHLEEHGYKVEMGKSTEEKIDVPVLFGQDNQIDKSFYADALSADGRIVIEVEAGQATENHRFLKDIFEACMMFDVEYLVLAVRNIYRKHDDFQRIFTFLETLYISNRLQLPLKGILLIGY